MVEGNSLATALGGVPPRGGKNLPFEIMYRVYILRNIKENRYHIGHTANISKRLNAHNAGKVRSSKAYRPWEILYTESVPTKQKAYAREMQIKSYRGGNAFKELIEQKL